MIVINLIVKYISFFGTIFKATTEQMVCRSKKILIEDVRCFSKGPYCGHILHELATNKKDAKAICMRPFYVNLIFGFFLLVPAAKSVFFLESFGILNIVMFYIGISFWTNLFPSEPDSLTFHHLARGEEGSAWSRFLSSVMSFGSKLEKTGVTLITSIIAAFLLAQCSRLLLPYFYDFVQELSAMAEALV